MVVGVTGKYCAGKSTVAEILERSGYERVDVDALGHQALEAKRDQVIERFGEQVADDAGAVDRRALGALVFSDDEAMADLEAIVHPWMIEEVRRRISARVELDPEARICVDAAILFKMGLQALCDLVIWVDAPLLTRLRRARRRDRLPWHRLLHRFRSQRTLKPPQAMRNPQQSPYHAETKTVHNDGGREVLIGQLSAILPLE